MAGCKGLGPELATSFSDVTQDAVTAAACSFIIVDFTALLVLVASSLSITPSSNPSTIQSLEVREFHQQGALTGYESSSVVSLIKEAS